MRESFSGFKSPTVMAAGRGGGAVPAWIGAHPGFTDVITDNGGTGDYTVHLTALSSLLTLTTTIIVTSETANLFGSAVRVNATDIRIRLIDQASALIDGNFSIIILAV